MLLEDLAHPILLTGKIYSAIGDPLLVWSACKVFSSGRKMRDFQFLWHLWGSLYYEHGKKRGTKTLKYLKTKKNKNYDVTVTVRERDAHGGPYVYI